MKWKNKKIKKSRFRFSNDRLDETFRGDVMLDYEHVLARRVLSVAKLAEAVLAGGPRGWTPTRADARSNGGDLPCPASRLARRALNNSGFTPQLPL